MNMMFHALDITLRLSHPFMPFLTEGLWQELDPKARAEVDGTSIMLSSFPSIHDFPEITASQIKPMNLVLELVDAMRRYGASSASTEGTRALVSILPPNDGSLTDYLEEKRDTLGRISRLKIGEVLDQAERERVTSGQKVSSGDRWSIFLQPVESAVEGTIPIFVCS